MDGSPKTSRNQLAGGFKKINWAGVHYNFDFGGGKYDKATDWLKNEHNVINLVFDPYNRSYSHNTMILDYADKAEITTLFNVLNVIPIKQERSNIIKKLKHKKTKRIFITVYEKNKTGEGEETRDGWQNNMRLKEYLPEVQKIYPNPYINKGMIIINLQKEIL